MIRRRYPRYERKERVALFSKEDKQLISEGNLINLSVKGCRLEVEQNLKVDENYYIIFGYLRTKKVEILANILNGCSLKGRRCYSAKFVSDDIVKKNTMRNYVDNVRLGNF